MARALEEIYASRLEEHAAELAEHFSHSSDAADLTKAVSYGEMAAKRAADVYAYGEAVRLLEQALKVQEILDPEDKVKRCDLLLDLCDALSAAGGHERIVETEAPAAFFLAESIGDDLRAVRACSAAITNLWWNPVVFANPKYAEWPKRVDHYAKPDTRERVFADMSLGCVKCGTGDIRSGLKLLLKAHDLACRLEDQEIKVMSAAGLLCFRSAPQHAQERLQLAEDLWATFQTESTLNSSPMLQWIIDIFLALGQRKRAEEVYNKLYVLAQRTGEFHLGFIAAGIESVLALMDGRLGEAIEMAERIRIRAEESGLRGGLLAGHATYANARARIYTGAPLEALERRYMQVAPENPINRVIQAHLGRKEELSQILERNVLQRPGVGTSEDETYAWHDVLRLEAAVLVDHHQAANLLLKRFEGTGLHTPGFPYPTCLDRHLGGAGGSAG